MPWLNWAGELFEALGMLSFFREQVLGPMLFRRANLPQRGVRRIEALGIDPDGLLTSTLATHDRHSVGIAIRGAADAYVNLRADALPDNIADDAARRAVLAMLDAYSHKGNLSLRTRPEGERCRWWSNSERDGLPGNW